MSALTMNKVTPMNRLLPAAAAALLLSGAAYAAAPGITGPTFNLTAQQAYISQPDGQMIYSWGYGCNGAPGGYSPTTITTASCSSMQIPGPTLIVTEGDAVTVTLTNNLPTSAGNTSILFPGFNVTATPAASQPLSCTATTPAPAGLLTTEAAYNCAVTYTFTAGSPGTRAYYSGTQADLQVEMGMYGAIIVLPKASNVPMACKGGSTNGSLGFAGQNGVAEAHWGEKDFRLASAAYGHGKACYDREYLFQFSEMDPNIHTQALAQVTALGNCAAGSPGCNLSVPTEPYHPAYFMINGRSMPDDMDGNYAFQYPHQPYNGNPHMHPGEQVLLRVIGQGRWQHPFHEHGNHVRILGRDGNLILSQTDPTSLAGPLLFTTTTTPGLAMDGIFYWTGRGLNWDPYGHNPKSNDLQAKLTCTPDANGYNTGAPTAINYYEWCQDHNKPLEAAPFGDVAGGGPATLPDPNLFTNGAWYGGSPYLGPNANTRATAGGCTPGYPGPVTGSSPPIPGSCGGTGTTPPSGTIANSPTSEAGFAFMWHSHNEREITTNNIFPGGMMMMMLVDSREFVIDESN
jgi:FtsP/CotA-like multicopper oxidase with cupredoxin domain